MPALFSACLCSQPGFVLSPRTSYRAPALTLPVCRPMYGSDLPGSGPCPELPLARRGSVTSRKGDRAGFASRAALSCLAAALGRKKGASSLASASGLTPRPLGQAADAAVPREPESSVFQLRGGGRACRHLVSCVADSALPRGSLHFLGFWPPGTPIPGCRGRPCESTASLKRETGEDTSEGGLGDCLPAGAKGCGSGPGLLVPRDVEGRLPTASVSERVTKQGFPLAEPSSSPTWPALAVGVGAEGAARSWRKGLCHARSNGGRCARFCVLTGTSGNLGPSRV